MLFRNKWQSRYDLFFSEELKNRKLEEILMTDMGYSEKEVKVFIKGVMTVENQRYKVKTPGMKDRFKNVKQGNLCKADHLV